MYKVYFPNWSAFNSIGENKKAFAVTNITFSEGMSRDFIYTDDEVIAICEDFEDMYWFLDLLLATAIEQDDIHTEFIQEL